MIEAASITIALTPAARAQLMRYARDRKLSLEEAGVDCIEAFLRDLEELRKRIADGRADVERRLARQPAQRLFP